MLIAQRVEKKDIKLRLKLKKLYKNGKISYSVFEKGMQQSEQLEDAIWKAIHKKHSLFSFAEFYKLESYGNAYSNKLYNCDMLYQSVLSKKLGCRFENGYVDFAREGV